MSYGARFGMVLMGVALAGCSSGGGEDGHDPAVTVASAPAPEAAAEAAPSAVAGVGGSRTLGFVMAKWRDEVPSEVDPSGCPDGMTRTEMQIHGIEQEAFRARIKEVGYPKAVEEMFPPDACKDHTVQEDPGHLSFDAAIPLNGLDLDGVDSQKGGGGACAHDDFVAPDGRKGIDNQHWRLFGCVKGYQPGGLMDRLWDSGNFIKEGVPILVEVTGVDDTENDDEVQVRIASSADTASFDATGGVMRDTSLRLHDDERYRGAFGPGRIENGVLHAGPLDARFQVKQQVLDGEFYYRDVRIEAEIGEDGTLSGILGAYWDVENLYSVMTDYQVGELHFGRSGAENRGFTCAGLYHAVHRLADGHPDPESGKCTSLSTAIRFAAVPAFLIASDG